MGSAVVSYVRTGDGRFGGYLAFCPPAIDFASSYLAELYAMLRACKWAYDLLVRQRSLHGLRPQISTFFDSTGTEQQATMKFIELLLCEMLSGVYTISLWLSLTPTLKAFTSGPPEILAMRAPTRWRLLQREALLAASPESFCLQGLLGQHLDWRPGS